MDWTPYIALARSPVGAAFAFVYGAVIGSFVTLLVYRLPRRLPWAWTRSKCTACNHVLGASELLPIASWCLQKGRCKNCGVKISVRYPLIEVGFGLTGLASWYWLV